MAVPYSGPIWSDQEPCAVLLFTNSLRMSTSLGLSTRTLKSFGRTRRLSSWAFFGDGAVNSGSFHEAVNFGAVWDLPVIFVCENNLYATEMAFSRATKNTSVASRANSYCLPGVEVDGQDVMAVRDAVTRAVARARGQNTPTLIEVRTYRFMGHSMSDAVSGTYRSKEELDEYMKRDPIAVLRAQMEQRGEWSDDKMAAIDDEVRGIVEDAWNFADESPEPPLEALTEDVYVDTTSDTATGAATGAR